MDWASVARTGIVPNLEFEASAPGDRLRELDRALALAASSATSTEQAMRLVQAVLHLLDAFNIDEPRLRASAGLALGVHRARLGQQREAIFQFRRVLEGTDSDADAFYRAQARINLASLIAEDLPDEACALLEHARACAREQANRSWAAAAAITLGSLLRRRGDIDRAIAVYRDGLRDLEDDDRPMVEGSLHGNLGNLLSNELNRPREALEHYQRAVAAFERGGHLDHASARRFHIAKVAIQLNDPEAALAAVAGPDPVIAPSLDALWQFLDRITWSACPITSWPRWEEIFERFLALPAGQIDRRTRASLLATCLLLRQLAGDHAAVVRLAEDEAFQALDDRAPGAIDRIGGLRDRATRALLDAADKLGRRGLMWLLPGGLEHLSVEVLADLAAVYRGERATIWLAAWVDRLAEGTVSLSDVVQAARTELEVHGIARVPEAPPGWLGEHDPRWNALFATARRALAGSQEENFAEFIANHNALTRAIESGDAATALAYARQVMIFADRDGHPHPRCDARARVALWLQGQPGGITGAQFKEACALLRDATRIARGVPTEEVLALLGLGTILKEAPFGDQARRIDEAIAALRRAHRIAIRQRSSALFLSVLIELGNALAEHPSAEAEQLEEAIRLLGEARAHVQDAPEEMRETLRGTVENSFGSILSKRAESGEPNARELLAEAAICFERALAVRERSGTPKQLFLSLSNLIGVCVSLRNLGEPMTSHDIGALASRLRDVGRKVHDLRLKAGGLINAATVLAPMDPRTSLNLARDAVDSLRGDPDATQMRVMTCAQAARLYQRYGEHAAARLLCEEGIEALERFRAEGGDAFYRGGLTREFRDLYDSAIACARSLGAPPEEIWWTMERRTGRTLAEDLRRRGFAIGASRADVIDALCRALPDDTLVVQFNDATVEDLSWMRLRRSARGLEIIPAPSHASMRELIKVSGGTLDGRKLAIPLLAPNHAAWFERWLRWVSQHILVPILGDLDRSSLRRMVFISQGLLNNIPWALVPLPDDPATPLGSLVDVYEAPSATALAALLTRPRRLIQKAVLIACDPKGTLSDHITEAREAFTSSQALQRVVLTDRSQPVTVRQVLEAISDADLVHFACHGRFDIDNPDESGLLLSDGVLSIRTLQSTVRQSPPHLAFLSACETGVRSLDFDDAPNLLTAFLDAGASVAIGAQWPVPDAVARDVARLFYQLSSQGLPAVAALCGAQRELRGRLHGVPDGYHASFRALGWG